MFCLFLVLLFLPSLISAACGSDPWSLALQSSTSTSSQPYTASISGSSGPYSLSITGNSGTVTQGSRTTNVVINWQIPWGSDVTLYAFIGADDNGIMMGWAYCHGEELTDVWLEDTTGQSGFTSPKVTGSCSITQTSKSVQLSISERCYSVNQPPSWPTISGSQVSLPAGSPGSITLSGSSYSILPFAVVPCTDCHSTLLDGGWTEIHAVMKSSDNVCLGIFYLQSKASTQIPLNYVNCFFKEVDDLTLSGTYNLNASGSTSSAAAGSTTAVGTSNAVVSTVVSSSGSAASTTGSSGSVTTSVVQTSTVSTSTRSTTTAAAAATTTSSTMQDLIGPPVTSASSSSTGGSSGSAASTTVVVSGSGSSSGGAASTTSTAAAADSGAGKMVEAGSMTLWMGFISLLAAILF